MAIESDVQELKRLCMLLFLELQDIRHRLAISPIGLLRSLKRDYPNFD
jgi:hypothetical protein